ncbi:hypothetical protein C8F01DRAFT_1076449 [Mycena amicta]|nr:hypothetical protein C8F01DRAFT_1076449 [Mycena amicta]
MWGGLGRVTVSVKPSSAIGHHNLMPDGVLPTPSRLRVLDSQPTPPPSTRTPRRTHNTLRPSASAGGPQAILWQTPSKDPEAQSAPDSPNTTVVVHRWSSSPLLVPKPRTTQPPLDLPPRSSLLSSWNTLCRHSTTSGEPVHFGEGLIAWEDSRNDWFGRR